MPTELDFIRAINADPDDDSPRLIFADWLDEQGECERAEFIRVQIALGGWGRRMSGGVSWRYERKNCSGAWSTGARQTVPPGPPD